MANEIPPPPKGCIFCGNCPTSSEHLVPRWAIAVFKLTKPPPSQPDKAVWAVHKQWSEGAKVDVLREWRRKDAPKFTVKCVCEQCNQGWMSNIESDAQPIVAGMMQGQRTILDTDDQRKIAKWLGLKAIISQYGLPPGCTSLEWTRAFAIERSPPISWHIRIGRYEGTLPMFWANTPFDTTIIHPLVPFPVKLPGFLFTAQLGHFVGQVMGIQQRGWAAPHQGCFIQIWPHPLLRTSSPSRTQMASAEWPPEIWLDDSDLKKCGRDPTEPKK
jgi:hypothetical protein